MNKLLTFIILPLLSCQSTTNPKYIKIEFYSNQTFSTQKEDNSTSLAKLTRLPNKLICDIVRNDTICFTKTFAIENDSILGNWLSMEDYSYRVAFPDLDIKKDHILFKPMNIEIEEKKSQDKWIIDKQWGTGLLSTSRGVVNFKDSLTTIRFESNISTSARPFKYLTEITIREVNNLERQKFDLRWSDQCIQYNFLSN